MFAGIFLLPTAQIAAMPAENPPPTIGSDANALFQAAFLFTPSCASNHVVNLCSTPNTTLDF